MFNDCFIKVKKKMNMIVTLSFIIILTMVKEKNKYNNIRILVKIK